MVVVDGPSGGEEDRFRILAVDGTPDVAGAAHLAAELRDLLAGGHGVVLDFSGAGAADAVALSAFFARLGAQHSATPVPAACPDTQVRQLVRRCGSAESGVVLFDSLAEARASARRGSDPSA